MEHKGKRFIADVWKAKIELNYLETGENRKFVIA